MTHLDIAIRDGLPPEMRTLLRDLPRDGWQDHANFARPTAEWMRAHLGFRQLGQRIAADLEAYLVGDADPARLAGRLARSGDSLVRHLHGHHAWEDRRLFPELSAANPRFDAGLAMLERDHLALDDLLDRFTRGANRVVQLEALEPAQMRGEAGPLRDVVAGLNGFLARHLTDEEDLVVPIVLHHKLRG